LQQVDHIVGVIEIIVEGEQFRVDRFDLIEVDDRARGVVSWIEERDKAPFADDPIEAGVSCFTSSGMASRPLPKGDEARKISSGSLMPSRFMSASSP
jgi:hypothetical protein